LRYLYYGDSINEALKTHIFLATIQNQLNKCKKAIEKALKQNRNPIKKNCKKNIY